MALALIAPSALAATITPISQARTISASARGGTPSSNAAVAFEAFSASVNSSGYEGDQASASQSSSILLQRVQAGGGVGIYGVGTASSSFFLSFTLDEATFWSLTGYTAVNPFVITRVSLAPGGGGAAIFDTGSNYSNFNASGMLPAGIYELRGFADVGYQMSAFDTFNFTFTIPEPTTGTLLGVGMLTLALRRRCATRRRR